MRDAEELALEIDRAITFTGEPRPDWPEAVRLIEADRREAKLETLRQLRTTVANEILRRTAMSKDFLEGVDVVLIALLDAITKTEQGAAIRSGAEPEEGRWVK